MRGGGEGVGDWVSPPAAHPPLLQIVLYYSPLLPTLNMHCIHSPMKRLDQGHLHAKLEVPGLIGPGRIGNRTLA